MSMKVAFTLLSFCGLGLFLLLHVCAMYGLRRESKFVLFPCVIEPSFGEEPNQPKIREILSQ